MPGERLGHQFSVRRRSQIVTRRILLNSTQRSPKLTMPTRTKILLNFDFAELRVLRLSSLSPGTLKIKIAPLQVHFY